MTMLPMGVFQASAAGAATQTTYATGDIINFGSYPQTKVTDSGLIVSLNAQTLGADSTVTYGGSRYKRVYFTQYTPYYTTGTPNASNSYQDDNGYYINTVYWFKYEPIQWRVLSNTNGELFVIAEKVLASRPYNQADEGVAWENCTLRSWLNNEFYNEAFNTAECAQIITGAVVNHDNPEYVTDGEGNNTADKVFLLSYSEVMNPAYGFSSDNEAYDTARRVQGTDFAKSNGLLVYDFEYFGNSDWWLRSSHPNHAGIVSYCGYVKSGNVNDTCVGIRPALKINL